MIAAWLSFFDGLIAVAIALVGILGAHFGLIPPLIGFQLTMVFGVLIGLIGAGAGLIGVIQTRSPLYAPGRPRASLGLALSLAVVIPVLVVALSALGHPGVNDVTTDYDNPPEFAHAGQLPENRGRDMKYDRVRYMARQKSGYPEALMPLQLNDAPPVVFQMVKSAASRMSGWTITSVDPSSMTIEGVSTSSVFRFRDDFVVQVRPATGGSSLVEMRSKSRDPIIDFGANYRRITAFFARLGKMQKARTTS